MGLRKEKAEPTDSPLQTISLVKDFIDKLLKGAHNVRWMKQFGFNTSPSRGLELIRIKSKHYQKWSKATDTPV